MKRELHTIVSEGDREDVTISIEQKGKTLIIKTEREGVASSVLRVLVKKLTGQDAKEPKESCIGFKTDLSEDSDEPKERARRIGFVP